jgi:hypothetical protein
MDVRFGAIILAGEESHMLFDRSAEGSFSSETLAREDRCSGALEECASSDTAAAAGIACSGEGLNTWLYARTAVRRALRKCLAVVAVLSRAASAIPADGEFPPDDDGPLERRFKLLREEFELEPLSFGSANTSSSKRLIVS